MDFGRGLFPLAGQEQPQLAFDPSTIAVGGNLEATGRVIDDQDRLARRAVGPGLLQLEPK